MKRVTYFAVFEPAADGAWGVYFPDLPGCITLGDSFESATRNAEEALGLHLWGMEADGEVIPSPSAPPMDDLPQNAVLAAITVYPDLVRQEMESRSVRTNVSLPAWLKNAAESAGLNYSQVLQAALMEHLGVEHNDATQVS